jgi:hypothetical protein
VVAVSVVVGSYVLAQYLRVWRPRRRGERVARVADAPPVRHGEALPFELSEGSPATA